VKICVGTQWPGGHDAKILFSLEDSELFDYFETREDGSFEHTAQARRCLCADLVEPIIRREIDAVVVKDLTTTSLFKFASAKVKVYVTQEPSVKASLEALRSGTLEELGMRDLAKLSRKHRKGV
jgi:predicted Fe-Mo cluster-binding NifX family protein